MQLRDVAESTKSEIMEHAGYLATDPPMSACGKVIERFSELSQGYAICMLLGESDEEQFREHLRRSACANRYFRRKSAEQGNQDDRHLGLSRSEAFLDALAAGEMDLARDIARLSPTVWRSGWEYEDDFCYFRLLYAMLQQGTQFSPRDAEPLLERFEQILEGDPSPRWSICRAMADRDEMFLGESLRELLDEKAARDDARRPSIVGSNFLFWPQSFVSIEGLAILRLASLVGVSLTDPFPLCPEEARLPESIQPYDDIFVRLEEAIAADR